MCHNSFTLQMEKKRDTHFKGAPGPRLAMYEPAALCPSRMPGGRDTTTFHTNAYRQPKTWFDVGEYKGDQNSSKSKWTYSKDVATDSSHLC